MNKIRLYYCAAAKNFGDQMSPELVAKLSGRVVASAAHTVSADLIAMGSVFYNGGNICEPKARAWSLTGALQRVKSIRRAIRRPLIVWGTGFLTDGLPQQPNKCVELDVRAVRGKRTAELLKKAGFAVGDDVVLGDPGLIYPKVFDIKAGEAVYDLGIIPHMSDTPSGAAIKEVFEKVGLKVKLISVEDDVREVVEEIASCRAILSSSLHGLILADALGIVNRQLLMSYYSIPGDQFFLKFKDYYSAYDRELPEVIDLKAVLNSPLEVYKGIYSTERISRDQIAEVGERLEESFPKELIG